MARKSKNKASKRWISQEEKEFAGPISLAISATAFSNSFTISPNGNLIFPYPTGCINLAFGLLFFLFGFWITPPKNIRLWSRILIPVGFAFIFIGLRIASSNLSALITGSCMGRTITIGAIIMIILGICLWYKAKADNRNKKQKRGA